jgi:hypothetical protein
MGFDWRRVYRTYAKNAATNPPMMIMFAAQTLSRLRRCLITCLHLQKRKLIVPPRRWTKSLTREPAIAKADCTNEKMVWIMLVKISKIEPTRSENALTIEDMVMAGSVADSGSMEGGELCL